MANKNGYLAKKANREQALIDIAARFGAQQVIDYLALALHDPVYMGDNVFGRDRIMCVIAGIMAYDLEFSGAYNPKNPEADVLQEKLDRMLKEIYGPELVPFSERQPDILQLSYKPRKEWLK